MKNKVKKSLTGMVACLIVCLLLAVTVAGCRRNGNTNETVPENPGTTGDQNTAGNNGAANNAGTNDNQNTTGNTGTTGTGGTAGNNAAAGNGTAAGNGNTAKAGTYTAKTKGYGGEITVTLTVSENGEISNITVEAPNETENIGQAAAPKIAESVVSAQSLDVDVISGATITSEAVLKAVEDCMNQAGMNVTRR